MATILVVEDDAHLRFGLEFNLKQEGHEVLVAADGEAGLELWRSRHPDLILLDIMLPGRSGLEVLEDLRQSDRRTPVIILTARSDESDAVCALSLGADDYVRKPFGVSELLARIAAVLRRSERLGAADPGPVEIGAWTLDLPNLRARSESEEIALTATEVEILRALIARRGEVVSREDLLREIWGVGSTTPTRTVDNHVARLRKKLEADPHDPRLLLTIHGAGYKLAP